MLDIIRKREFFAWADEGLVKHPEMGLKAIQDAWALSMLRTSRGLAIAEVGGGRSRVLEALKGSNECWNIDKFEGAGGGPVGVPKMPGVTIVPAFLGDFDARLRDGSFDAVFSVSVVEHVPTDRVRAFFQDCSRILKPGGLLLHAIDLYVYDEPAGLKVVDEYRRVCDDPEARLAWLEPPRIDSSVCFTCDMASNPDTTMAQWNKSAPALRDRRERAQSVSIKAGWRKRDS